MIEKAIRKLLADAATTAADRIFPNVAPQDQATYPIIVYQRISTGREHSHTQRSSGLVSARIQIRAWAKTYDEAKVLDEAIRKAIDGYQGTVAVGSPAVDYEINSILATDDRDDYDEELRMYGTAFDVVVWYNEAQPT